MMNHLVYVKKKKVMIMKDRSIAAPMVESRKINIYLIEILRRAKY